MSAPVAKPAPLVREVSAHANATPGLIKAVRRHPDPKTRAGYIELMPESGGAFGDDSSIEIAGVYCAEEGGVQAANAALLAASWNACRAIGGPERVAELRRECDLRGELLAEAMDADNVNRARIAALEAENAELMALCNSYHAAMKEVQRLVPFEKWTTIPEIRAAWENHRKITAAMAGKEAGR